VDVALLHAVSTGVAVLSLARSGDGAVAEHLLGAFLDRLAAARS
jgi:hypothetical protein